VDLHLKFLRPVPQEVELTAAGLGAAGHAQHRFRGGRAARAGRHAAGARDGDLRDLPAAAGAAVKRHASSPTYERIWAVVARIPRGRVATYGQVAKLAGLPRQARRVGYALHALPVGATFRAARDQRAGRRERARRAAWAQIQRELLRRERVAFDERGRVDLERFGWKPRAR